MSDSFLHHHWSLIQFLTAAASDFPLSNSMLCILFSHTNSVSWTSCLPLPTLASFYHIDRVTIPPLNKSKPCHSGLSGFIPKTSDMFCPSDGLVPDLLLEKISILISAVQVLPPFFFLTASVLKPYDTAALTVVHTFPFRLVVSLQTTTHLAPSFSASEW